VDVDAAIAFIQGSESHVEAMLLEDIAKLAEEEKFEEAEDVRRRLEKIQRARKEVKDTFASVWGFDYLVLLPSDSSARTKVAFVRSGGIIGFEQFETASLPDLLPAEVMRRYSAPEAASSRDWQYDEFCLVANYLVHPLKSVELVRLEPGIDLAGILKRRRPRKTEQDR
jgi:excinuclease UvrABC nuclease subunit